jgi:Leucine-rich repeat (LRR) protein
MGRYSKKFPNLIYIEIHVSLTAIDEKQFITAANLQTLDLSENKIQQVHVNAFIGLHSLTTLKLNRNQILSLAMNVFADLPILKDLNLMKNNLTSFDFSIVKHNPKLNKLTIKQNTITHVMTSKQNMSNLLELNIGRNLMTSLPMKDLPECPKLQKLYIYHNKLPEFSFESVKEKFPKLIIFRFGNNSFDCCYLMDKVNIMKMQIPNLDMGVKEEYPNNTKAFQDTFICITCDGIYQNQKRLGELEATIGKLQEKNTNFFIIGLAVAVGFAVVVIALILMRSSCCSCSKNTAEPPQSKVEFKIEIESKSEDEDDIYGEIPTKVEDAYESYYCN